MTTLRQVSVMVVGLLATCLQPMRATWGQVTPEDVSNVETLPAPKPMDPVEGQTQTQPAVADALGTYSILRQPESAGEGNESPAPPGPLSLPGSPDPWEPDEAASSDDWDRIEQYDVLSRGPLHEAFAQPQAAYATSPVMLEPPQVEIQEIPPGNPPAGNNVQWINGYWGWSEDLSDYVWVTGIYRDVPPGRRWVGGFWSDAADGYRWNRGYWAAADGGEVRYLPTPPDLAEGNLGSGGSPLRGPTTPATSEDSFWLPGHWHYVGAEYQWQEGYWTKQQANWIWTPASYLSTPEGYVFVSGFWDYEPTFRGRLYAPIVFRTAEFLRRDYRLQPVYPLLEPASLVMHVFVVPGSPYYYFGNFYSNRFTAQGFRPWYAASTTYASASMLSYYQWKYDRANAAFKDSMLDYYQFLRATPAARPTSEFIASQNENRAFGLASSAMPSLDSVVLRRVPWEQTEPLSSTRTPSISGPNARASSNKAGGLAPDRSAAQYRQSLESSDSDRVSGLNENRLRGFGQSNSARVPASGSNFPQTTRSTRLNPATNSRANSATVGQNQPSVSPFPGRPLLSRMYQAAEARGAVPPGFPRPPGVSPPGIGPPGIGTLGGPPRAGGGILRGRRGR